MLLREHRGNGLAKTADNRMLLGSDHATSLLGAGNHQALIKRLDRMHIDDLGFDAIGSERLGSLKRLGDHKATSDDGHIGPLAHDHAATNLELIVLVIVNDRCCQAAEAHVNRALKLIAGAHTGTSLDVVGGNDHRHTGIVRMSAISSQHWCVAPSSPTEIPAWVAPILTLRCG